MACDKTSPALSAHWRLLLLKKLKGWVHVRSQLFRLIRLQLSHLCPLLGASKERAMLTKQRGVSEKRGRIFAQVKSSIYPEHCPAVSAVKAEMGSVCLRADNEEQ
jgi:hypothetical protein